MVTRITGLSSGMDIDALVTQLMTAEKIPLDKMKQNKQTLAWKSDAYREINKQLATFNTAASKLRFSSQWQTSTATSSDTNIATVSVGSGSNISSHKLVVKSLATGATLRSNGPDYSPISKASTSITASGTLSPTTSITAGQNDKLNVTLDGATKTITLRENVAGYSPDDLVKELQGQLDSAFGYNRVTAGYVTDSDGNQQLTLSPHGSSTANLPQLTVSASGTNQGLTNLGFSGAGQSLKVDINAKLSDTSGLFNTTLNGTDGSFKINGVKFTYTKDTTIASIMSQVNASSAGVRMSYDSVTDQFSITSKTTGNASQIKVEDVDGNLAEALGFGASNNSATGTDADVEIDGVPSKRSSNSFTVDGITYNLVSADPDKTITVNATQDTSKIYDAIKSFVDAYNTVQTLIKTKLNETVDKNYPPLTEDQKKDMSDDDIKLWEDKAKVGVLRSDSILRSISDSLRQLTSASVSTLPSDVNSLFTIGITTMSYSSGSYDVTTSSNLEIDETKLRAAIEKDPESVIKLFSNQPSDSAASKTGIAQQMYTQVNSAISQLVTKAGGLSTAQDAITSTIGKQLHDLENDIDDFQDKLDAKEDRYYQQFSAMESAVAKGNSTLSWLSSFG